MPMTKDQRAELGEPPPDAALKTRQQAKKTLTYIEGHYVIEQMNSIFGSDGWRREFAGKGLYMVNERSAKIPAIKGQEKGKTRQRWDVAMLCEYTIIVGDVSVQDVGYGIGQSYSGPGDAYESAAKEAVTDALKRCCRSLGNAFGNCLYDKEWLKNRTSRPQETNGATSSDDDFGLDGGDF